MRRAVLAALGLLAAAGGVTAHLALQDRVDRRIATGTAVNAEVTDASRLPWGRTRGQWITVRYTWDGARTARLAAALDGGDHATGDRITLRVDPRHPERVATADGFASEGLVMRAPSFLVLWGAAGLLAVAWREGRERWSGSRRAPRGVPLLSLSWTHDAQRCVLPWLWERQLESLAEAAPQADAGPAHGLHLHLRFGGAGKIEVERRGRQIGVTVPVEMPRYALDVDPREPIADALEAGLRAAEKKRGADLAGARAAVESLREVAAPELA